MYMDFFPKMMWDVAEKMNDMIEELTADHIGEVLEKFEEERKAIEFNDIDLKKDSNLNKQFMIYTFDIEKHAKKI